MLQPKDKGILAPTTYSRRLEVSQSILCFAAVAKAYKSFLNKNKIKATLPKYHITRPLTYIPPEQFLDKLIASCNGQMSIFLQTLKETAARPGEALRL
jgi:hypothetical protein